MPKISKKAFFYPKFAFFFNKCTTPITPNHALHSYNTCNFTKNTTPRPIVLNQTFSYSKTRNFAETNNTHYTQCCNSTKKTKNPEIQSSYLQSMIHSGMNIDLGLSIIGLPTNTATLPLLVLPPHVLLMI